MSLLFLFRSANSLGILFGLPLLVGIFTDVISWSQFLSWTVSALFGIALVFRISSWWTVLISGLILAAVQILFGIQNYFPLFVVVALLSLLTLLGILASTALFALPYLLVSSGILLSAAILGDATFLVTTNFLATVVTISGIYFVIAIIGVGIRLQVGIGNLITKPILIFLVIISDLKFSSLLFSLIAIIATVLVVNSGFCPRISALLSSSVLVALFAWLGDLSADFSQDLISVYFFAGTFLATAIAIGSGNFITFSVIAALAAGFPIVVTNLFKIILVTFSDNLDFSILFGQYALTLALFAALAKFSGVVSQKFDAGWIFLADLIRGPFFVSILSCDGRLCQNQLQKISRLANFSGDETKISDFTKTQKVVKNLSKVTKSFLTTFLKHPEKRH